jgi:FkbM family methyltransferase
MTPAERIAAARRELVQARAELQAALQHDRTRRRGALMRQVHEIDRMLRPDDPWRSQAGQDRVVDRLLGGKRGGVFVDVGGYDGVTGSNTLFFEESRGWTGVLVEPVPAMLDRARRRRRCPCLGVAVATSEGEAEFIEVTEGYTQMSGLAGTYDPALLEQVRADPRHREAVRRVPTRTLSAILTEEGVPDPDFLSLDIEGGEIAVLEAFPFERHRVAVWSIENNTADPRIAAIMRAHGYDLVEFCGPDDIYLKSRV